jgi:hypothetical protein
MKKTSLSILLIVVLSLAMLSACGGGTDSTPQPPPYQPATAVLTLVTSGPSTTIYGIDVTVVLPDGVTAKSTAAPPRIDDGVVTATGGAAGSYTEGVYTPATGTSKGTVRIMVASGLGFGTGDYSTVNLTVVSANTPTTGSFSLKNFSASDENGAAISTLTPGFTASIQ